MKYLLALALLFFINSPTVRADCIQGTQGCDACPAGDTACATNAQTVIQQGIATPPPQQPAQNGKFVALSRIPGLTDIQPTESGLAAFFNNLYKYLIGFSAVLAIIMIIWGGLEYATQDSPWGKSEGKSKILQAIFGLILVLAPALVFSIINPSILNLSINFQQLDTKSGASPSDTRQNQLTPPESGCNVREGKYLESAVCKTPADASSYPCKNGGSLIIPSCQRKDPSGKCLDVGYPAYCSQSAVVVYQKATHLLGLVPGWDSTVIPRDAQKAAEFTATCQSNGGQLDSSKTLAAKARIYTRPINYISPFLSGSCPEDSGVVIETAKQYDVICFDQVLACIP